MSVVLGSGGGRAIGLLAALGAAWLLGPAQFGVLGFAQATAVMVSSFGGLALPAIVTREVAQNSAENTSIARSGLLVAWTTTALVAAALLVVILFGFGLALPEEASDTGPLLLGAIGVSAAGQSSNGILLGRLLGLGRLPAWSRFTALRAVMVGVGTAVFSIGGSGAWAMVGAALGEAALSVVYYRRLRADSSDDVAASYQRGWRLLKHSAAPALAEQGYQGAYWLGQVWLVSQPNGLVLVGWYTLANRLLQGASFLPLSFVNSYASALHRAAATRQALMPTFRRTLRLSTLAALVATAGLSMGAFLLARLSDEYAGAAPTIAVLSVSLVFLSWNSLVGDLALAMHQVIGWALSDVVLALVFLGIAWLLIPSRGSVGLAVASAVSYAASVVFLSAFLLLRGNAAPAQP